MTRTKLSFAMLPLLATLILAGCRVGPVYKQPVASAQAPPAVYKEAPVQNSAQQPAQDSSQNSDGWKPAQPQDAMLRGKWWEIYNQPELNDLEEKLNVNNQNIKVYFENYMAARTLIAQARSQLYPTLTTAPSYARSRSSANIGSSGSTTASSITQNSLTALPLTASWEPDLWGKIRNAIREEQYNAQLSAADLANEELTEQATLAEVYFELRGQDALVQLYKDTVAADQKAYDIAKAAYEVGTADKITEVEALNTLQNAQSAAINLGVARAQYEHAIATLIGTSASGFSLPAKPMTTAPPAIPLGLPSQLLERRPDIAAAERQMAAANAQIGVAVAAFYPNLTLSAEGGLESSTFKHLLDWPSRFWSVGPSVSETIFDAGLRRATVNQYVATYNGNVATYRQTVLTAFQQVEDYLAEVRILDDQIRQQQLAEQSAQEYLKLQTARYETGVDPYVDVVTAQTTLLNDQQSLTSLHIQQMTASVQLVEALGGGWDTTQLPSPAEVSKKLGKLQTTN